MRACVRNEGVLLELHVKAANSTASLISGHETMLAFDADQTYNPTGDSGSGSWFYQPEE